MARRRLVVVGGDAAGMSAASQARRLVGPDELEIVAFERGHVTSYAACGIPHWIGGLVEDRDDLVARTPERFREDHAIDARIQHEAVAIDTAARTVTVRDLAAGTEADHGYDELLLATGAVPLRPPIPGIDADGVFGVQTLDDGQQVLDALASRQPSRAVVIGAGYIGVEMAEAMRLRGIEVDIIERSHRPITSIDEDLGEGIAEAMAGMGMTLHLDATADAVLVGDDGFVRAVATSDGDLPCDLVLLGTGTRPNSDLARDAEVPVGETGGIATDARQRTPVAGVWAAGDCTQTLHRVTGRPAAIALGTIANKQGRIAGRNLGGVDATFPGVLGTAVTKVCGLELARTGLGETEATQAGFDTVTATITSTTRAAYYPDARPITVKAIARRGDGRLLGAQIVGEEGAAKRIDVLAMAVWHEMAVADLIDVDLSYAPPFAPVWDPVLTVARRAAAAVAEAG